MSLRRLVAGLCLAGALAALAGCSRFADAIPPEVHMADLRPAGGGLFEQQFVVELRVVNPNDFPIDVQGMTFDLALNGQPFAKGLTNQSVTVPRLGEARVPVAASTNVLDLARQLLGLAGSGDLSYRISGVAYLAKGLGVDAVPYEQAGSLGLSSLTGGGNALVPR